jgi:hypothetical protein
VTSAKADFNTNSGSNLYANGEKPKEIFLYEKTIINRKKSVNTGFLPDFEKAFLKKRLKNENFAVRETHFFDF